MNRDELNSMFLELAAAMEEQSVLVQDRVIEKADLMERNKGRNGLEPTMAAATADMSGIR